MSDSKKPIMFFLTVLLISSLLAISGCGNKHQAANKKEAAGKPRAEMANDEYVAEESQSETKAGADKSPGGREISFVFLAPTKFANERLLEYDVNLTYETRNFELSRKDFLDIVSQFGFLGYTSTGYQSLKYLMSAQFNVKVADLYNVIKLLDRIGSLKAENISVSDHTKEMIWNQRKAKRQKGRDERISKALAQVAADNKNWRDREDALERSEDVLDQAEQAQWDITDQVTWAKISVTIQGPNDIQPIQIPSFRNAVILLVNGFFKLIYVIVILIPLLAIGAVIWWQRKNIKGLFSKKK